MSTWEQQIEQDLEWREAEMAYLKLLVAGPAKGTDRHNTLLRAAGTMLYAHYEGFCKFCWDLLLDGIEKEACCRKEMIDSLAILSMAKILKSVKNSTNQEVWDFINIKYSDLMGDEASFPVRLETNSNLWPELAQRNNESIGLRCPKFIEQQSKLKQLVGHRNEIAHGKKLMIKDLHELQAFEHAAQLAMHDLAVAVVECLNKKSYLKP